MKIGGLLHLRLFTISLFAAVGLFGQTLFSPGGAVGNNTTNGNVGVGTSSPSFKLEVVNDNYNAIRATGSSTNAVGVYIQNSVSNGRQWALTSSGGGPAPVGSFLIWDDSGGGARLSINSAGNVGIGTTNPTYHLQVESTADHQLQITGKGTGFGGSLLADIYSERSSAAPSTDRLLRVGSAYAPDIFGVFGSGNVGIGTVNPNAKLFIDSAADTVPSLGLLRLGGSTDYSAQANNVMLSIAPGVVNVDAPGVVGGRLKIDAIGRVGIGLTDPRWRLGVLEGVEIRADDADSKLTFHDPGQVWYTMGIDYSDNRSFKLGLGGNVGDVTDVTLTPGGNFGLGTSNPQTQLDVVSSDGLMARFVGLTSANQAVLIGNASQANYMNLGIGGATATSGVPYIWSNNGKFMIGNDGAPAVFVSGGSAGSKVGIGTISPSHTLTVNGSIRAKEIVVDSAFSVNGPVRARDVVVDSTWADYVFAPDYALQPLSEVEAQIKAEKHLPGLPSAQEVAKHGVNVGEMQAKLLAKIEELTLHVIAQEKRIERLENENAALRAQAP